MRDPSQGKQRDCWCGHKDLAEFSADYRHCQACGTLVSQSGMADDGYQVRDDESDFYGKSYWLDHMTDKLGLPKIQERSRLDLPERCVYWLRHLLSFRLPPSRILELGSAHGGFVALMSWAGYDAVGLELSPWVADLARTTFRVPMLVGQIEEQSLMPGSIDVVVAHDVMEHLPDPLGTLGAAVKLLGPNGILVIQMPEFVEGKTYAERLASKERFLDHTKEPDEHLYLYSRRSVRQILSQLGLGHVEFFQPIFDYDMYFVAGRQPLTRHKPEDVSAFLQGLPQGRLVLALLDKCQEYDRVMGKWSEAEADRAARLEAVKELDQQLAVSEADRAARLACMKELERLVSVSQADNGARLRAIMELSQTLLVAEQQKQADLRIIREQDQIIYRQQTTIRAMQKALGLPLTNFTRERPPIDWQAISKRFAKMLVPQPVRKKLRRYVTASSKAETGNGAPAATTASELRRG